MTAFASAASVSDPDGWLVALRSDGPTRDQAVECLRTLLMRAARWEVARRDVRDVDRDDVATAATEDALDAVLSSLDAFRRPTPFETWACKFALVEAAAGIRRHEWRQRAVSSNSDGWAESVEALTGPESGSADADLLRAIVRCMRDDLTADQRRVLIALAIEDVPIDVLAERLDTTRGALHRTLRDARRRVRGVVDDQGSLSEAHGNDV